MPDRVRYAVNVCVLLRRADRWLLDLRQQDESSHPGRARGRPLPGNERSPGAPPGGSTRDEHDCGLIGLIGGHVEVADGPDEVLETAARRELAEETGIDLTGTTLRYVASELYEDPGGRPVVTVTYAAELPSDRDLLLERATEPGRPAWWTLAEVENDPRCAPWVPRLIRLAGAVLG